MRHFYADAKDPTKKDKKSKKSVDEWPKKGTVTFSSGPGMNWPDGPLVRVDQGPAASEQGEADYEMGLLRIDLLGAGRSRCGRRAGGRASG